MVALDQPHHALRCAVSPRHLRAATGVVEVARERGVASGEARSHARRPLEKHARDAVPEEGVRRLRRVVQHSGDDELLVRAELPKNSRGLGRMPIVGAGRAEVPDRLLHTVKHG